MKPRSLLFLVLIAVVLVAGGVRLRACALAATEAKAPATPAFLAAGPLRHLSAASAGRVWEVYVQPGSVVKRGQLLAKVAVPLHSVAQQQAERELAQAEQRHAQLLGAAPGSVSGAVLKQARQRVATVRQRLAAAPRHLAFVYVQAPAAGTVARLPVHMGAYVSDSTTIVSMGPAPAATLGMATK